MSFIWHWPQITWAILAALHLFIVLIHHGEPRTGKHDFGLTMGTFLVSLAILYFGGFFAGAQP